MLVLGIESSCDETAAAVVRDDGTVISDVVASQVDLHAAYGGVVPELASRAHARFILPVLERAIADVPQGLANINGIAVTRGPGLMGALLMGVEVAKAIAWSTRLPLVGVDHLFAHLLAIYLKRPPNIETFVPNVPFVALLASGGHTALYEVHGTFPALDYTLLGQTRDDAAGEAFDKTSKLLGLGYPGGPIIDRLAAQGDPRAIHFTLPMARSDTLEFSFSGLKTAVALHVASHGKPKSDQEYANLCASFQRVLVEVLVKKSIDACRQRNVRDFVLAGGVAANRALRARAKEMCDAEGIALHVPHMSSCTDNAAMIAYLGALRLLRGENDGYDFAPYARDAERRRGRFL